ncbi:MAG: hypothetical protein WC690_08230, partial [bacterium]
MTLGFDLKLETGNQRSHRLVMADVRKEIANPDETQDLFGLPNALEAGLIGNAADVLPYAPPNLYPASVINDPNGIVFQWCVKPKFALPFKGYNTGCEMLVNNTPGNLSDNKYSEVFLYDLADTGNGFVSASYDPLIVKAHQAGYLKLVLTGPPQVTQEIGMDAGTLMAAFYSPLALFRKVDDGITARYRFSGYTSWDMPKYTMLAGPPDPKEFFPGWDMWPFIFTNWIVPVATNPIAVEAVDMAGASSWQACGNQQQQQQCLDAASHPDTDTAVAYQTTFYDLDMNIADIFGRPAVFGDGKYHKLRELMVTCNGGTGNNCPDEKPLTADLFPDNIISLLLFWQQQNKWNVGGDTGDYPNVNPSHVLEPMSGFASLIGPGVYDTAVLTDFAKDAAKRDQHVLVPSEDGSTAGKALIYDVNKNNPMLWFKAMYANGKLESDPATGVETPKCDDITQYKETPFHRPGLIYIDIPPSAANSVFVPYQIRSGDLDGDKCEDFIVTWRGKNTIKDAGGAIRFDDGSGTNRKFANRVTIVLRHEEAGACERTPAQLYPAGIPLFIDVPAQEVASAAIGDFDADGKNDIVAGNQIAESFNNETTAVAYVFKRAKNFTTIGCGTSMSSDCERIRVGVKAGAGTPGVAMIEADRTRPIGPDAIAQINGKPLMLPDIGCPKYDGTNEHTVGSVFETYVAMFTNFMTQWAETKPNLKDIFDDKMPFVDTTTPPHPMPERCGQPAPCGEQSTGSGGNQYSSYIPLFADDPCCGCSKYTQVQEWQKKCGVYLQNYGKKASCDLFNYAFYACPVIIKQKEVPTIDQQNRGFASNWRPDDVVTPPAHAIADARDLIPAEEPITIQPPQYQLYTIIGAIPLQDILADWIEEAFKNNPTAADVAKKVREDKDLKTAEDTVNAMFSDDGIIGPPLSAEQLFLKPMAAAYKASSLPEMDNGGGGGAAGCQLMKYNEVKLPKGMIPEPRETTAVVRKMPEVCNGDRIKNLPSEQCDIGFPWTQPPLTQADKDTLLAAQCTDATQGKPIECGMAWCNCVYEQPGCVAKKGQPGIECTKTTECAQGQICDVECKCQGPGGPGQIPGPLPLADNGCVIYCGDYSSDDIKKAYETFNAEARTWINENLPAGQTYNGDIRCQPEHGIWDLCKVAGGSAPGVAKADISLSLSGTPLPDSDANELSFAKVQETGSMPIDMKTLTYTEFTPLSNAIMLIPVQGGASAQKALIVPDISAGIEPMAVTSVTSGTGIFQAVNNMYELRIVNLMPGQTFTAEGPGGASAQIIPTPQELPSGAGISIHQLKYTLSPLCGPYVAVTGFNAAICKNMEERKDDPVQIKESIIASLKAGMSVGEAIRAAPMEQNAMYVFRLDHGQYVDKNVSAQAKTISLYSGVQAGGPIMFGKGSGCGCNMGSA